MHRKSLLLVSIPVLAGLFIMAAFQSVNFDDSKIDYAAKTELCSDKMHLSAALMDLAYSELELAELCGRKWFYCDRDHFRYLFEQEQNRLNNDDKNELSNPFMDTTDELLNGASAVQARLFYEIAVLQQRQQQLIQEVAAKHTRYRIYSPEETDKINSLFIAMRARQFWLSDLITGEPLADWKDYYPEEYIYAFFDLAVLNIQGGVQSEAVEISDQFNAYDEAAVIALLDKLPVPDQVYQGKEIFFVNGTNKNYGAVHANGQILIFNLSDDPADLLKLVAHEIGHEAGYLIFGRDGYVNENIEAKAAYAGMYGFDVPCDSSIPWGYRLCENFAEDFGLVYGGFPRWTLWRGAEVKELQSFIETSLDAVCMEDTVLIRDNLTVTADGQTSTFFGGYNYGHYRVIVEPEVRIQINGFQTGMYELHAHVRNNVTGKLAPQDFNDQGEVVLQLGNCPEELQVLEKDRFVLYEVQIKMYHFCSARRYHNPTIARFWLMLWNA